MERPRFIPTLPSDWRHLPLLFVLILSFTVLFTVLYVTHDFAKVDGDSMEPTLRNGDRVLISKGYDAPRRGDIVSFRVRIGGQPDVLIKRVVALPGDSVEIMGDRAFVNGSVSPYDAGTLVGSPEFRIGPLTVPDGMVYVLGDNRAVSLDSRFIGPVLIGSIRGAVTWVFLPVARFDRIDANGSGS